ncbi:MAG: EAL domain-containing protein [Pseudomonadota bacterium]
MTIPQIAPAFPESPRSAAPGTAEDALALIRGGALRLAWQPVRAASGAAFFEEGLARLALPCGALLPAGAFVPLLEEAGAAAELDRAALDLTLARLAEARGLRLSVNLSADSLGDGGWHARLLTTARDDADAARRLIVEITETAAPDIDRARVARRAIGAQGPAVALDDFGAGHATEAVALALRPDILKLDRRFAADLRDGRPGAPERFAAAHALAARLEAPVIAEGAETPLEALRLIALGADGVQGYGVGLPQTDPASVAAPVLRLPRRAAGA